MSRRAVLAAAELILAAAALSAAVYGLVRAAYDPYAAVTWVPIATVGAGTALALVGTAALLFGGRVALALAAEVMDRRSPVTVPPAATAPLWEPRTRDEHVIAAYAAPGTGRRARTPADTQRLPAADLSRWQAYDWEGPA